MSKTKELLENQVIYNGYVFTKDRKRGYYLSAKPIYNGKRINLHRYVWIINKGDIPKGFDVHHKDANKDNNDISNLMLLPGGKHSKYHINKEMLEHYDERKNRFIKFAHPEAIKWHKSSVGREWHKKHWKASIGMHINETIKKVCLVCGTEYDAPISHKEKGMYCSNKCKSKYRRDNKLDHIKKKCVVCGESFMDSKYGKRKTCSQDCKIKLFLYNRDGKEWW